VTLSLVILTTDFETRGSYIAEMKGVVLQLNPGANLVDISQRIDPQSVTQVAFVLWHDYQSFPKRAIYVDVVDPGVGTLHCAALLVTPEAFFLASDNGLLTYALRDSLACWAVAQGR
jgi:S-adenosylmethionine hydrolase